MQSLESISLTLELLEEQLALGSVRSPCAYLKDRESTLLLLDGRGVGLLYRLMLDRGYRRHGIHIYRPDCAACKECRILRTPLAGFTPTKSQRRVLRKTGARLRHELGAPEYAPEKLELYRRYLQWQHAREEATDELSEFQYREFFVETCLGELTRELRLYDDERLVGLGVVDFVGDALSSVYFFFDPEYAHLSPGAYSALLEIRIATDLGLRYYYPGYYIRDCAAMNYKLRYGPNELREIGAGGWVPGAAESELLRS